MKKETAAQVFSYEFCKISRNTVLQNTSLRLLMNTLTAMLKRNAIKYYKPYQKINVLSKIT